ncbi:MAG TPA: tetratricopeptide repeat protein [Polyangiaceae bacterium]|nr:tetratricopeptide repeat protein [Polyangiaceae bacterium]
MAFSPFTEAIDAELDLVEGAATVARIEYPGLRAARVRARLDELAAPLARLGLARLPALAQARALADHLHVVNGFRGNADNYFDPSNSFINVVLERRLGIPITLAVVYVEVARRVGVSARGVGFPGHFLVRVDDRRDTVVLDPFFGGEVLDRVALGNLLQRVAPRMTLRDEMLDPVSVKQLVARMLMNLRGIYAARADSGRLLAVLDHLIDLMPEAADEVRDRGFLCARLGAPRAAVADLRRYVDALPHAGDVAEVRRAIERLEASAAPLH